jgi:AraC-like DNA-binding protein
MIGVRLRPGVAFLVSGIASHALVGRRIALTDVPACCGLVSGESSLRTPAECLDALQAFLIERLANATVNPAVAAAMDHVERQHGCVRVGDIAAHCGVSVRHLNRLMRTWVGYGPKVFATIIRFQESLKHLERVPTQSGAALASNAGYFDQAHLTLDLRRFAGSTPGHLASRCVADFSKTYCDDRP